MSLFELIELSQNIGFRIDAQWEFFLTVHMALFGGIIYVDRPLRKTEKLVAVALYSGFAVVNFLMLPNQLDLQRKPARTQRNAGYRSSDGNKRREEIIVCVIW